MSAAIDTAVTTLNQRLQGGGLDGTLKIVIEEEGVVLVDASGARPGDPHAPADCTLTAGADTFRDMLERTLDPTAAYMGGRLSIQGDMGLALALAGLLG